MQRKSATVVIFALGLLGFGFFFLTHKHATVTNTTPAPTASASSLPSASPRESLTQTPNSSPPAPVVAQKDVQPVPSQSFTTPPKAIPTPRAKSTGTKPIDKVKTSPSPTTSCDPNIYRCAEKIIPYVPGNVLKAVLNEGVTGNGWIAGIDISPGTYYSYEGCSILVASPTIKQYNIGTQPNQLAQVTLTANMQMAANCDMTMGTPTIQPTINSGMHIVGQDILPGTYSPSQNCYYWQGSVSDLNAGIWYQVTNQELLKVRSGSTFQISNLNPGVYFNSGCGVLTKVN